MIKGLYEAHLPDEREEGDHAEIYALSDQK